MTCRTNSFITERLAEWKRQLALYDDAITALTVGIERYEIDTGQGRQTVTRSNIAELQTVITTLEGKIVRAENRLNCNGGVTYGRPAIR